MTRRVWTHCLGLLVLGGLGCVHTQKVNFQDALCTPAPVTAPQPLRNQVYLYILNGSDLLDSAGLATLRDQLCFLGFPKVSIAQRPDVNWYHRELRRIARDEPGARLLLMSFGSSATRVHTLATEAVRDGLPLDAVIFLDPIALSGHLVDTLPVHTVVLKSHNWPGSRNLIASENLALPGVGHFSLPTHEGTVQLVHGLMHSSTGNVELDSKRNIPRLPLTDSPSPTPRPIQTPIRHAPLDEWDFLKPIPAPGSENRGPGGP